MALDVSLDIETLAATKDGTQTGPVDEKAKIMQIGVTVFNSDRLSSPEELLGNSMVVNVDRYEGQENRTESADTLKWWSNQNKSVWDSLFVDPVPLKVALVKMLGFMDKKGCNANSKLWIRGQDFDLPIIKDALYENGLAFRSRFWVGRDLRSAEDLVWGKSRQDQYRIGGEHHNALADAASQAYLLQALRAHQRELQGG